MVQQPWAVKARRQAFARSQPTDADFANGIRALLNPANPSLSGTKRPYFPRGGPLPPPPPRGLEKTSSGWGGLDAGENMLYPAQVVDGLVHNHAGSGLAKALASLPMDDDGVRVKPGGAFVTSAFALLNFDVISHTPTPFWPEDAAQEVQSFLGWANALTSCVVNGVSALRVPMSESVAPQPMSIAVPLLGAGAAGAPVEAAAQIIAHAASILSQEHAHLERSGQTAPLPLLLRFVLPGEAELAAMHAALREEFGPVGSPCLEWHQEESSSQGHV